MSASRKKTKEWLSTIVVLGLSLITLSSTILGCGEVDSVQISSIDGSGPASSPTTTTTTTSTAPSLIPDRTTEGGGIQLSSSNYQMGSVTIGGNIQQDLATSTNFNLNGGVNVSF